jgi:hypothetical protein
MIFLLIGVGLLTGVGSPTPWRGGGECLVTISSFCLTSRKQDNARYVSQEQIAHTTEQKISFTRGLHLSSTSSSWLRLRPMAHWRDEFLAALTVRDPSRGGANDLYFTCKQYKHHGITIIRAPRDPYISISSTIESQLTWLHCIKSSCKSSTLRLVSAWPKPLWSSTKNANLLLPVHSARKAKDNATTYYRPALGVKGSLRCRPKSLLS